ncbi:MAG: Ni/Fe hydrogenase subunit alpha [Acidobacteriota bacterium]
MSRTTTKNVTIKVDALARVEGEGGMTVKVRGGRVQDVALTIFEPPRFFEAFLRGRSHTEPPDITARICGICPVAYQMSACHAIEDACGVVVDGPLRELRRLLYCGEWIESHVLHVFMLHAPDFLGYESAIHMAADHPDIVERALRLKKTGNDLLTVLGGRSVHPINVRIGGFYRVPTRRQLQALIEPLSRGRDEMLETVRWLGTLDMPDFERDYDFVAMRHDDEYPFNEGRLVSSSGLDLEICDFDRHFEEIHVERSNALHSVIKNGREGASSYFVGPQARYSLNYDKLSPLAQDAAQTAGLGEECRNPFQSIVVRAVETVYAFDEALRILEDYRPPERPAVPVEPRAGVGHGCTEAPRGILYHRYRIDEAGLVQDAKIVPPTSQNQSTIEADLHQVVEQHLELPKDELTWLCEQAIRNYDPCISCATHFLRLEIDRD